VNALASVCVDRTRCHWERARSCLAGLGYVLDADGSPVQIGAWPGV
jgi:hypothetical protein